MSVQFDRLGPGQIGVELPLSADIATMGNLWTAEAGRAARLASLALGALDALPKSSVMVFNAELRYLIVRGGALAAQGVEPEALEGRLIAEVLSPERFSFYEPLYRAALRGETTTTEVEAVVGDEVYLIEIGPTRDEDGRINGGVSIASDITDQKRSERWFRQVVEAVPDALVISDASGTIVLVNEQAEAMFGYTSEEFVGMPVEVLVPDRLRARHRAHRGAFADAPRARRMGVEANLSARRRDGSTFPVDVSLGLLNRDGAHLVVAAIRDMADVRRLEEVVELLVAVVNSSHDAIVAEDLEGTIISWNGGAERLYGYGAAEAIGQPIAMLATPDDADSLASVMRRAVRGEHIEDFETWRRCKDGTSLPVSLTVSPIHDRQGAISGTATIGRDITERRRYQAELRDLAEHDPMTGATNRRRFEHDLDAQLARCRRYHEVGVLLSVDLDGLKSINDTYGHKAGDEALKAVVSAIGQRLRATDTVARVGGDEFAVLLPHTTEADGNLVASQLRDAISAQSIEVATGQLPISVSVGLAVVHDQSDADLVLAQADAALYRAKKQRNQRRPS